MVCQVNLQTAKREEHETRTDRSWRESNLCRGITVTSSISQRKAISGGVRPGGSGRAMMIDVRVANSMGATTSQSRLLLQFFEGPISIPPRASDYTRFSRY
jgi:hypothetical protein